MFGFFRRLRRDPPRGAEVAIDVPTGIPAPLWILFPDLPWGSVGWRMGAGELYWDAWREAFAALDPEARVDYRRRWPQPADWPDFYDWVEAECVGRTEIGPEAADAARVDDTERE